jgi:hypothetical protein
MFVLFILFRLYFTEADRLSYSGIKSKLSNSRIPHCLDNRLTDGGGTVILKRRSRSTAQKGFSFCFLKAKKIALEITANFKIFSAAE